MGGRWPVALVLSRVPCALAHRAWLYAPRTAIAAHNPSPPPPPPGPPPPGPYAPWWELYKCKALTRRLAAEGKLPRQPPGKQYLLWAA